ncbi:Uncharacterised protein [uncultured archaeon]|nr:Uncharacterised protein [uncultured archaeon]
MWALYTNYFVRYANYPNMEGAGSDQIRGWSFLNMFTESDSMNMPHQVLSRKNQYLMILISAIETNTNP